MKRPRTSKQQTKTRRAEKVAKQANQVLTKARNGGTLDVDLPRGAIRSNWDALQHNYAAIPDITYPLYYQDRSFTCRDCGSHELWLATQQKWWYEVAKGRIDTIAIRCRYCRRKERERILRARKAQQEGLARKSERVAKKKPFYA
jgi:Probable zinc-ribbon domain